MLTFRDQEPTKVVYLSDELPVSAKLFEGYPDLLKPSHIAQITGLCEHTIRDLCRNGELPARKIGRCWFVPKTKFAEFVGGK